MRETVTFRDVCREGLLEGDTLESIYTYESISIVMDILSTLESLGVISEDMFYKFSEEDFLVRLAARYSHKEEQR